MYLTAARLLTAVSCLEGKQMKKSSFFIYGIFLILFVSDGLCQKPGQLYITGYDNIGQPVTFCDGILQNEIQISYGIANLYYQNDPNFQVDSIIFICDKSIFQYTQKVDSFTLGGVGLQPGPVYAPKKIGTDTLKIVGFYGQYTSSALIICHAVASPEFAFYGWTRTVLNFGAGFVLNDLNPQIRTDTLHDEMGGGFPFHPSLTPQRPGINPYVEIRSCGGATIDSIYTVGDFTEFEFSKMPQLPLQLGTHDSLRITYLFTPNVVGKFPHYLVFHTTSGKYLVWSFEYKVSPSQGVFDLSQNIDYAVTIFPNPASSTTTIQWNSEESEPQAITIYNLSGIVIKRIFALHKNFRDNTSGSTLLNTQDIPSGQYNLFINTKTGVKLLKLIITK